MSHRIDPFAYDPRLRKLKEYVEGHLDEPISLEDAARIACLEPKYFSVLFKQSVGIGFSEWLHRTRIREAQELLQENNDLIIDIALAVGYGNVRTFERAFRRYTGTSPTAFRRKMLHGSTIETE